MRILLVDDFKQWRQAILSLLGRERDLQVVGEAEDGLEAVEQAAKLRPDLILMDLGLPRLNGFAAAQQIRELLPSTRIVFVTQETAAECVQEAFRLGAIGYVHKSEVGDDLLTAVEAVLAGRRFVSSSLGFDESTVTEPRHHHQILFCPDETAFLEGLSRFIGAALEMGNAALVLASPSHHEAIWQRLRAQGVDIDGAIGRGTYVSWDADKTPNQAQFSETIRSLGEAAFKAGRKRPRVALCSERTYRLWTEGRIDEVIRLEQFCSELAKNYDVDILCPYPLTIKR